ncbi:MAG TPA: sialidase family protein [Thermodesulfovibrionales bacterium]|nr:sialidase family protein [Thermodesulfovibrionales bacterium]
MIKSLAILALCLMLAGPAYSELKANDQPLDMTNIPGLIKSDPKGNVYVAYYSKDGSLMIRKNMGPEVKVAVEGGMGTFMDLAFFNEDVVLVWRPKLFTSEKFIYVQRSSDGGKTFSKPVIANTAHDALPPIQVVSDGKSRMFVLWVDERADHGIYMNVSSDGGRTFSKNDTNLTSGFKGSVLPYLLAEGDTLHFFFFGAKDNDKDKKKTDRGAFYKQSIDGGKTWSEAVMIESLEDWAPFTVHAAKSGPNVLVVWGGIRGIHGALSKDGREWKPLNIKEADMKDVNRLGVAVAEGGRVFLVGSWAKGPVPVSKPGVFFCRSEDSGATWSPPVKLNTNEFDNTSSSFPAMHARNDGTILVAWQDHRDIRGDIYFNYSKDFGKTWLEKDKILGTGRGRNNNTYPLIAYGKGAYSVLWVRYANDVMADAADMFVGEVRIDKQTGGDK